MVLFVLLMQVQVDWRVWLYGMRPGRTLGKPGAESLIMAPEGFLLGVGHSRPYPDLHAVAWALTPQGYTLWQFHQDTVSYDLSLFIGCCASPLGYLYAGGYADFPGESSSTLFVVRFNPVNGFPIWSYTLPYTADRTASGSGLFASDPNGNLIACGDLWTPSTGIDIHAISLDTAGNLRWYFRYDGPWHAIDQSYDMAVDQDGNTYLVGMREDTIGSCPNTIPLVIKLDTAGNLLWMNVMTSLTGYVGQTLALFDNWIYISGVTGWRVASKNEEVFVARLDTATGSVDWYERYNNPLWPWVNDMILDENCNIYLAGEGGPNCFEVMCVDSNGSEKWRLGVESGGNHGIKVIRLDSLGNLFAGGTGRDEKYPVVYKLDTLGNLIWAWRDTIPDYDGSTVSGLVPDGRGGVYVQERFTAPDTAIPYYTNITSVVHLTDGQAIAENPGKGQEIRVLMAPDGLWVSGYEGEVRIYDPAGRLIIKREISVKTLIGPLSPGVYFVVAGKERAKVAVR